VHDEAQTTLVEPAPADLEEVREGDAWLCCRQCGGRIALAAARVSFDGGHSHRFVNPHGLEFRIGLFADAPGCRHEGESTEFFSWFPGYTWRIAICSGCRSHLGWAFECIGSPGPGELAGFHGLIVDRLRPES
jgi:hypothetical protein